VERIRSSLSEDLKGNGIPFGKLEREKSNQIVLEVSGKRRSGKKF